MSSKCSILFEPVSMNEIISHIKTIKNNCFADWVGCTIDAITEDIKHNMYDMYQSVFEPGQSI